MSLNAASEESSEVLETGYVLLSRELAKKEARRDGEFAVVVIGHWIEKVLGENLGGDIEEPVTAEPDRAVPTARVCIGQCG